MILAKSVQIKPKQEYRPANLVLRVQFNPFHERFDFLLFFHMSTISKQLLPWPLGVRKLSVFKLVSCNLNGNPRPGLLYQTFTAELRLRL